MSSLSIRPATAQDTSALVALIDALNRHEAVLTDDRRTDIAAARECLASLKGRIARAGGGILVAQRRDETVGMIGWVIEEGEPYVQVHLRRHALITDLVVAQKHRGSGIGGALIGSVEDAARAQALPRLAITVLATNQAAIDAYRAHGFVEDLQIMMKNL